MVRLLKIFTALTWAVVSVGAVAQQPLIQVESAVDTSNITIGDRIHYSIIIDHIEGLRVEKPGAGINLGQFEIKDYKIHDPQHENGRVIQKFEYTISVFDTGSFTIPSFPVAYFPNDSTDYRIIEASPIRIYVRSVITDDKRELRDIKPPLSIPFDYAWWLSLAAIVLLLGAGAWFGYKCYQKRKEAGYLFRPPPPPRPAHEIALESLKALLERKLPEQGAIKEYYSEISGILRRYLEGRFFVQALEETSNEILAEMKQQEVDEENFKRLESVLKLADLVKFAKFIPGATEHTAIAGDTERFIEETKIEFDPAEIQARSA